MPDRDLEVGPALLDWYDRHRRVLPWRSAPGAASDPYAVWLSEIMLQQTTVAAVKPYFAAFLAAWPTVRDLAAAPLDDILKAWAGLGYYSRARNLHACARAIVDQHGGRFPPDEVGLRSLPGIGPYTAAAIAAIAFGQRAVVVDGNVERVMARLCAVEEPLPAARPRLHAAMNRVTPQSRTGDFAQAVMDLGATICTPRSPACVLCPLIALCDARRLGLQADLPRKSKKAKVPQRGGAVFIVHRSDGCVLVRQRPPEGLFGGMTEFPSTPWTEQHDAEHSPTRPVGLEKLEGPFVPVGTVEHGLTHFHLTLHVYAIRTDRQSFEGCRWIAVDALAGEALPTLMRKVARFAQGLNSETSTLANTPEPEPQITLPVQSDCPKINLPHPKSQAPNEFRTRHMPQRGRSRTTPSA
ncbi:A/G-specific adenine glycosylase [Lichenifustis flavocetrariae]|uniref:Adenine DNA glycosylase n=1 Tax=Lichenifustis flavocetrariae TaxID=2949735 RepID=A0AA41YZJ5_9HYPH|nr:A/G-specific adenine glycosylase [Lichenifustis flavocetrariae]MCW6510155.1 A/G-specific adenine glycosylase [Lichenifustis flavocetrariae]